MSLKDQLYENNYLVIDNFIEPQKANFIYEKLNDRVNNYKHEFEYEPHIYNEAFGCRNFRLAVEVLVSKLQFMSDLVEETLAPTYSYGRIYKKGGKLSEHSDRPSCEISATVHLGSDGHDWLLGIKKPNNENALINLKAGQAMIYFGFKNHWREGLYTGNNYGQLFLHYVKMNGKNWGHFFDQYIYTKNKYTFDMESND